MLFPPLLLDYYFCSCAPHSFGSRDRRPRSDHNGGTKERHLEANDCGERYIDGRLRRAGERNHLEPPDRQPTPKSLGERLSLSRSRIVARFLSFSPMEERRGPGDGEEREEARTCREKLRGDQCFHACRQKRSAVRHLRERQMLNWGIIFQS